MQNLWRFRNVETIERHLDALRRLSREADDLKNILRREKIANGVTLQAHPTRI